MGAKKSIEKDAVPVWKQDWFKQAVVLGCFSLAGGFVFVLYGVETKEFIGGLLGDSFIRWGAGIGGFALLSDLFFHFMVRK